MSDDIKALANAWLEQNSPKNHALARSSAVQASFSKAPPKPIIPVWWSFVLTGSEIENDLKKDQALDPTAANIIEKFKEAPLTGCVTVIDMARISSKFNPQKPDDSDNYVNFQDYTNRIASAPFFSLESGAGESYARGPEDDWKKTTDDIADRFIEIADADRKRISVSLKKMADAALASATRGKGTILLVQNAIDSSQKLRFYSYNGLLDFEFPADADKPIVKQLQFKISRSIWTFHKDTWPLNAESVARVHFRKAKDFVAENSAPPPRSIT